MNKYICRVTFISANTNKSYTIGEEIDQREFDSLSYADSRNFTLK